MTRLLILALLIIFAWVPWGEAGEPILQWSPACDPCLPPVLARDASVPTTWVPSCWEKALGSAYYYPCHVDSLIAKGWIEQRHVAWLERAQEVSRQTVPPADGTRCGGGICSPLDMPPIDIDLHGKLTTRPGTIDDYCLDKMRDAMRAMEPFIIEYDAENKTARAVVKNFPALEPVWKQWNATKAECWRKP